LQWLKRKLQQSAKNPATFLHKYCRIFYTLFYLQTAMLFMP